MPSADTPPRLFGIVGYPLERTDSPRIHNTAFAVLGMPDRYVPLRVAPGDLKSVLPVLTRFGVSGFNVTVPHKERIVPLLTELNEAARQIGAVNTVVRTPQGWLGANTDVLGFAVPLQRYRRTLRGQSTLMFGAGGAARAAAWVMICRLGIAALQVVVRNPSRCRDFLRWAASLRSGVAVSCEPLGRPSAWRAAFHTAHLVVNATPVGMQTAARQQLIPSGIEFKRGQIAYDMIYGCRTDFLTRAKRQKARILAGERMLLEQAAASFELWTGRRFPYRQVQERLGL